MSVNKFYPNALSISELDEKITNELTSGGFNLKQTVWGTSICSDEVNNSLNTLSAHFAGPGPFRFGGISGFPFAGNTGMRAFASHIPDDGAAFIIYGPHIGVSKNGELGVMLRENQSNTSSCCGSLVGAVGALNDDATPELNSEDYQQSSVLAMLKPHANEITSADAPIYEATEFSYQKAQARMKEMIAANEDILSGLKVYLVGGILINTDWDTEDYFDIRNTEIIEFS